MLGRHEEVARAASCSGSIQRPVSRASSGSWRSARLHGSLRDDMVPKGLKRRRDPLPLLAHARQCGRELFKTGTQQADGSFSSFMAPPKRRSFGNITIGNSAGAPVWAPPACGRSGTVSGPMSSWGGSHLPARARAERQINNLGAPTEHHVGRHVDRFRDARGGPVVHSR